MREKCPILNCNNNINCIISPTDVNAAIAAAICLPAATADLYGTKPNFAIAEIVTEGNPLGLPVLPIVRPTYVRSQKLIANREKPF